MILFLVLLICVSSQSVKSSESCNGPPTCNCNYGTDSFLSNGASSNKINISQGKPGKKGPKGDEGSRGQKGQKGNPGVPDDTRKQLQHLQNQMQLLTNLQNTTSKNCYDVSNLGIRYSGIYSIMVNKQKTEVYCDMETDGGGWTVIQRRTSNLVDFYRDFEWYKQGFGDVPYNFWLGLDTIHAITSSGSYKLRVDLQDFSNNAAYALYSSFSVGNESSNYRLQVSGYSGNAGDSLIGHNKYAFTTKDQDNDVYGSNCAVLGHGAWWYGACALSNLNGKYFSSGVNDWKGVTWKHWKDKYESLKRVEMKIKPK